MTRLARTSTLVAAGAGAALALSACGGGGFDSSTSSGSQAPQSGPVTLKMLVGTSNDVELGAVKKATESWAAKSGNKVEVTSTAKLPEELAKGFAGGSPSDIFYLEPAQVGTFTKAGNLYAYGDQLTGIDYIPALKDTFTIDGKLQCAPKDFSTLALVINQDLWTKAGLTDADVPKDWAGLEKAATRLTAGNVTGLVINPEYQRVGTFMAQAGGSLLSDDAKTATADSPENLAGLTEAQKLLKNGSMKLAKQVDAGWGGEALIKGRAAMTIEGNWIRGALSKDAPTMKVKVVELPAGPKGKGTLMFTNCWGIAARSTHQAAAVDLVKFLAQDTQQLEAAKAFGVMPSTTSAMQKYTASTPDDAGFVAGAQHGKGMPTTPGVDGALGDFNAKVESLATGDPKAMLATLQSNLQAALKG
ncbi:sugar ABC transporter substrate-binding protein [Arsenicicoccus sp. oral taxon 190]|uniref:sugar ABC transporter substrate-binding protein n=1 Tax=Arsenicicoccus sp. oral taxon 190 TaxID=1658671 RepID=UPI000AE1577A|nr:extracellular solute-binding protein [Arsenicicoccus sp. oral taxon 190]